MNHLKALFVAPLLAFALAGSADAQVGKMLPEVELKKFGNTEASDYSDFTGRAVLIEFFAYW